MPKNISGACVYDGKIILKVYNGSISLVLYQETIKPYSYFYPLDKYWIIRIGGRTYGNELPTLDIVEDRGDLIVECYLPEPGVVVNAVPYTEYIFFSMGVQETCSAVEH